MKIGNVPSMERVLVAPNLPVPFLLGGDYLWRHRCLADYFNAQCITRAVPQRGSGEVGRGTAQLLGNAPSMGSPASAPLAADPVNSSRGYHVPEAQHCQNFTLFAAGTSTVDPHCQVVIRVPHGRPISNQNVLVEPAFTLFRRGFGKTGQTLYSRDVTEHDKPSCQPPALILPGSL